MPDVTIRQLLGEDRPQRHTGQGRRRDLMAARMQRAAEAAVHDCEHKLARLGRLAAEAIDAGHRSSQLLDVSRRLSVAHDMLRDDITEVVAR